MSAAQALTALLFVVVGLILFARGKVLLSVGFLLAALILANTLAHADEPRVLTVGIVTDYPASPEQVDEVIRNVNRVYQTSFGLSVRLAWQLESDDVPTDTSATFLLPQVQAMDHKGANVVVLLTRRRLHVGNDNYEGWGSMTTLGAANAAAIVRMGDSDYYSATTMMHELAHTMGVPHDGEGVCYLEPLSTFVMSRYNLASETFSPCSVRVVKTQMENTAPPKSEALVQAVVGGAGAFGNTDILVLLALLAVFIVVRNKK